MSSDEVMALATDALRGQLLSVLPEDASVIVGAPQVLHDGPARAHESLGEGLSQPGRWASLASGALSVRWVLLDLPLEQVSGGQWRVECGSGQGCLSGMR